MPRHHRKSNQVSAPKPASKKRRRELVYAAVGFVSVLSVSILSGALKSSQAETAAARPGAARANTGVLPRSSSSPVIQVEGAQHDFGDVWAGADVEHTFRIHNRGDIPLEIRKVQPSCGCTSAGEYPKLIQPGDAGLFPFRIKTVNLRGPSSKTIKIESNDPARPELVLTLKGNYLHAVEVSPSGAFLGNIVGPGSVSRAVTIKSNVQDRLQLKLRPSEAGQVRFKLDETIAGKEYKLEVTTVPPHQPGIIRTAAVLETNVTQQPLVSVPITGRVPERIDLYPQATVQPNTPAHLPSSQLSFLLTNHGTDPIRILDATTDDPGIKVTIQSTNAGQTNRIVAEIPKSITIPAQGRWLTVKTDDAEFPVLRAHIHPPKAGAQARSRPAEMMKGRPMPEFTVQTTAGRNLTSNDFLGQVTVLNFISLTCSRCKEQLPELERLRQAHRKGVEFINVVNPNPTRKRDYSEAEILQVLNSAGSQSIVALDRDAFLQNALKVTDYPTVFAVDESGRIALVGIGLGGTRSFSTELEALLANSSSSESAAK